MLITLWTISYDGCSSFLEMFGSSFASIASSLFSLEHSFIYSTNRVIKHLLCARHCDSMLEFAAVKALLSLSKLVRYWAFSTEPLIFFLLFFICSFTLLYFLKDVHGFIFQIVSWFIFNFNSFFFLVAASYSLIISFL